MNFNNSVRVTNHLNKRYSGRELSQTVGLGARDAVAVKEASMAHIEQQKRCAIIDRNFKIQEDRERIVLENLKSESVYRNSNSIYNEGKTTIFKSVMAELLVNSLNVADDDKPSLENNIFTHMSNYIDERGGYKLLEGAISRTNSKLLKDIKALCENTAKAVCTRHLKSEDNIIFSLNQEEENEFNYSKGNLNLEELTDLVKGKVLTVVLDEKKREKEEIELLDTLAQDAKEGEDIEDIKKRKSIDNLPIEEGTIFNALLRDSYRQMLESSVSNDVKVNMDSVMLEALVKYTTLELSHTIQLETFNINDIRKYTEKLLNKK